VLAPIFFGLSVVTDSPGPLIVPFTIFLAGIALMLYAVIFWDDTPRSEKLPAGANAPAGLRSMFGKTALGPGTDNWAAGAARRQVKTSELAQPSSVTENTTKLLIDDQNS
jgi:hypothetical protein